MNLRQAAQRALKAMEDGEDRADMIEFSDALIALRAALAEPEQEPVAYCTYPKCQTTAAGCSGVCRQPAPTPRKPLTVFEIDAIAEHLDKTTIGWATHEFAAAIEKAHGIGEQHE